MSNAALDPHPAPSNVDPCTSPQPIASTSQPKSNRDLHLQKSSILSQPPKMDLDTDDDVLRALADGKSMD
jgi:hypothetical protein